jgi:hypothetical protein
MFITRVILAMGLMLSLNSCRIEPSTAVSQARAENFPKKQFASSQPEQLIWFGNVAGSAVRWTTRDIFVNESRILSPIVNRQFEEFRSELIQDVRPDEQLA